MSEPQSPANRQAQADLMARSWERVGLYGDFLSKALGDFSDAGGIVETAAACGWSQDQEDHATIWLASIGKMIEAEILRVKLKRMSSG